MKQLTIAFPLYNEGLLAKEFIETLDESVAALKDYEVSLLIVNDGSTDDTADQIQRARLKTIRGITLISLSRNVGHSYAVQCLVDNACGQLDILMDADFQDDPACIPQLLELHEKTGADVVRVARTEASGGLVERILFSAFRLIYRRLTHETQSFGTFGLYSANAIALLRRFDDEAHRYFPGLVTKIGLRTAVLPLPRSERKRGRSKVGLRRLFRLAFDALFSFSVFPIRIASVLGVLVTVISCAALLVIVFIRLCTHYAIPGWSSILTGIMFFGGVQLLFLGVLGEYVARIFEQVKHRPHYFIESTRALDGVCHALPPR